MKAASVVLVSGSSDQSALSLVYSTDAKVSEIPPPDQVLIKVNTCSISDDDCAIQRGCYRDLLGSNFPGTQNYVPGCYFSGTVEAVGKRIPAEFSIVPGEQVVCFTPSHFGGGLSTFALVPWFYLARKPENVSFESAAALLPDAVLAYTTLYERFKVKPGDFIMIFGAAAGFANIVLQLAISHRLHVLAVVRTQEEVDYLKEMPYQISHIIDMSKENPLKIALEETGGAGVDYLLDACPSCYENPTSLKTDIIRCLAAHGHLATTQCSLQIDPPESRLMFLKGCTLSYIFGGIWTMCPSQLGVLHHMVDDAMDKLSKEEIKAKISAVFSLDKVQAAYEAASNSYIGRVIVKL